jgi:hypothetical protein
MTKPSVYELAEKWDRVLVRLSNGRLAGLKNFTHYGDIKYIGVVEKEQWHQDWELDDEDYAHTIDLWNAYDRKSYLHYFDIDAIVFLSNSSEVTDALDFGCDEDISWDWDINNPHNLKFKKGDVVVIDRAENRSSYVRMLGKVGTIVDAEYTPYVDDERITYRVRVDGYKNDYQENGLWVFHDESSLELYNPQCDDQLDAYTYSMFSTRYNITEIDDIIKGENNNIMNGILAIYEEKQLRKINKKYDDLEQSIKLSDERYKTWLECTTTLTNLYKEDKRVTTEDFAPIQLSKDTLANLHILYETREEELRKLSEKRREVQSQLIMCDTYDQKQEVLRRYNIINKNGKVNG